MPTSDVHQPTALRTLIDAVAAGTVLSSADCRRGVAEMLGPDTRYAPLVTDRMTGCVLKRPAGRIADTFIGQPCYVKTSTIPMEHAYGVFPGPQWVVFDLDNHGEGPSPIPVFLDFFSDLLGTNVRRTFNVITPSGGVHLYLRLPQSVMQDPERLGPRQGPLGKTNCARAFDKWKRCDHRRVSREAAQFSDEQLYDLPLSVDLRTGFSNGLVVGPTTDMFRRVKTPDGRYVRESRIYRIGTDGTFLGMRWDRFPPVVRPNHPRLVRWLRDRPQTPSPSGTPAGNLPAVHRTVMSMSGRGMDTFLQVNGLQMNGDGMIVSGAPHTPPLPTEKDVCADVDAHGETSLLPDITSWTKLRDKVVKLRFSDHQTWHQIRAFVYMALKAIHTDESILAVWRGLGICQDTATGNILADTLMVRDMAGVAAMNPPDRHFTAGTYTATGRRDYHQIMVEANRAAAAHATVCDTDDDAPNRKEMFYTDLPKILLRPKAEQEEIVRHIIYNRRQTLRDTRPPTDKIVLDHMCVLDLPAVMSAISPRGGTVSRHKTHGRIVVRPARGRRARTPGPTSLMIHVAALCTTFIGPLLNVGATTVFVSAATAEQVCGLSRWQVREAMRALRTHHILIPDEEEGTQMNGHVPHYTVAPPFIHQGLTALLQFAHEHCFYGRARGSSGHHPDEPLVLDPSMRSFAGALSGRPVAFTQSSCALQKMGFGAALATLKNMSSRSWWKWASFRPTSMSRVPLLRYLRAERNNFGMNTHVSDPLYGPGLRNPDTGSTFFYEFPAIRYRVQPFRTIYQTCEWGDRKIVTGHSAPSGWGGDARLYAVPSPLRTKDPDGTVTSSSYGGHRYDMVAIGGKLYGFGTHPQPGLPLPPATPPRAEGTATDRPVSARRPVLNIPVRTHTWVPDHRGIRESTSPWIPAVFVTGPDGHGPRVHQVPIGPKVCVPTTHTFPYRPAPGCRGAPPPGMPPEALSALVA